MIANGGHRLGHEVKGIVGVSSSEAVKSMRGICSLLVFEDIVVDFLLFFL